jgi:hypothetical protein
MSHTSFSFDSDGNLTHHSYGRRDQVEAMLLAPYLNIK